MGLYLGSGIGLYVGWGGEPDTGVVGGWSRLGEAGEPGGPKP